jgi:hypothetical protein
MSNFDHLQSTIEMKDKLKSMRQRTKILLSKHNWRKYFDNEPSNNSSSIYTESSFQSCIDQQQIVDSNLLKEFSPPKMPSIIINDNDDNANNYYYNSVQEEKIKTSTIKKSNFKNLSLNAATIFLQNKSVNMNSDNLRSLKLKNRKFCIEIKLLHSDILFYDAVVVVVNLYS